MKRKQFFVSRQHYYYEDYRVVEVETGGSDYAGADMLSPVYDGEAESYADPREAAMAAYRIWVWWQECLPDGVGVGLSFGSTLGIGTEHDPVCHYEHNADPYLSPIQLFMRADAAYAALPKCDRCGEVRSETYTAWPDYDPDCGAYCSEYCADIAARENYQDIEDEAEEEYWDEYPDRYDEYEDDPYEGEY